MRRIFLVLLLIPLCATAEDFCHATRLQLNGVSWHDGNHHPVRNDNPGMGLVCEMQEYPATGRGVTDLYGGYYRNSFDRDSIYLGIHRYARFGGEWHIDPGAALGIASGYEALRNNYEQYNGIIGFGYIVLSFGYREDARLNIAYAPVRWIFEGGMDVGLINLELSYR